jgi:hypothetical protein
VVNSIRSKVGSYSQSSGRFIPTAKVWPNGEFTLGYAMDGEASPELAEWTWTGGSKGLSPNELDERLECLHGWLDAVAEVCSVSGRLATALLTLSNARNSHETAEPVKYGLHGLTGTGAKMLRSACFLMEEKFGKEDVTMATFTVPRLSQAERVLVAHGWGVLTNRLVQYLKRELVEQGRPPLICGCVEIQSSRLESRNEGYLHLHVVWPAHSNCGRRWAVKADDARAWWKSAVERIIGRELPCLPRIETAIVEKSVEHYMGKYLSKGSDDCLGQFVADLGYESVPGQWWFASKEMKTLVKENTLGGRNLGALLEAYIEHTVTNGTGDGFEWLRHVDLPLAGRLVTVGYVGRLSRDTKSELDALMKTG